MTIIKSSVFHVLEKFPDRGEDIKRLDKESQEFQSVCEDYRLCAEALQHWKQSLDENAPMRVEEYEALLRELEEEVLQNVNEST